MLPQPSGSGKLLRSGRCLGAQSSSAWQQQGSSRPAPVSIAKPIPNKRNNCYYNATLQMLLVLGRPAVWQSPVVQEIQLVYDSSRTEADITGHIMAHPTKFPAQHRLLATGEQQCPSDALMAIFEDTLSRVHPGTSDKTRDFVIILHSSMQKPGSPQATPCPADRLCTLNLPVDATTDIRTAISQSIAESTLDDGTVIRGQVECGQLLLVELICKRTRGKFYGDKITVPQDLDLTHLTTDGRSAKYELRGQLIHRDTGDEKGHIFARGFLPDGSKVIMDDSDIRHIGKSAFPRLHAPEGILMLVYKECPKLPTQPKTVPIPSNTALTTTQTLSSSGLPKEPEKATTATTPDMSAGGAAASPAEAATAQGKAGEAPAASKAPPATAKKGQGKNGKQGQKSNKKGKKAAPPHPPCQACPATETSQWRPGPSGPGTLCNACGKRFARLAKTITGQELEDAWQRLVKQRQAKQAGQFSTLYPTYTPPKSDDARFIQDPARGPVDSHCTRVYPRSVSDLDDKAFISTVAATDSFGFCSQRMVRRMRIKCGALYHGSTTDCTNFYNKACAQYPTHEEAVLAMAGVGPEWAPYGMVTYLATRSYSINYKAPAVDILGRLGFGIGTKASDLPAALTQEHMGLLYEYATKVLLQPDLDWSCMLHGEWVPHTPRGAQALCRADFTDIDDGDDNEHRGAHTLPLGFVKCPRPIKDEIVADLGAVWAAELSDHYQTQTPTDLTSLWSTDKLDDLSKKAPHPELDRLLRCARNCTGWLDVSVTTAADTTGQQWEHFQTPRLNDFNSHIDKSEVLGCLHLSMRGLDAMRGVLHTPGTPTCGVCGSCRMQGKTKLTNGTFIFNDEPTCYSCHKRRQKETGPHGLYMVTSSGLVYVPAAAALAPQLATVVDTPTADIHDPMDTDCDQLLPAPGEPQAPKRQRCTTPIDPPASSPPAPAEEPPADNQSPIQTPKRQRVAPPAEYMSPQAPATRDPKPAFASPAHHPSPAPLVPAPPPYPLLDTQHLLSEAAAASGSALRQKNVVARWLGKAVEEKNYERAAELMPEYVAVVQKACLNYLDNMALKPAALAGFGCGETWELHAGAFASKHVERLQELISNAFDADCDIPEINSHWHAQWPAQWRDAVVSACSQWARSGATFVAIRGLMERQWQRCVQGRRRR